MLRARLIPQTTQIDDPTESRVGSHSTERLREPTVPRSEVLRRERMHQVESRVTACDEFAQELLITDVDRVASRTRKRRITTSERDHVMTIVDELTDEGPPDEATRAGNRYPHPSGRAHTDGHYARRLEHLVDHDRSTFAKISHASNDLAPKLSAM